MALALDGQELSYADLDAAVDRVAARLVQELGTEHPFIALRIDDMFAMATSSLAIDRAGMVMVPIDPTAPHDRVAVLLGEVPVVLLLSDVDGDDAQDWGVRVADPGEFTATPPAGGVSMEPGELAAIMFTSGSTGTPKGIMHSTEAHRRSAAILVDMCDEYDFGTNRLGGIVVGTVGMAMGTIGAAIQLGSTFVGYDIRKRGLTDFGSWLRDERIGSTVLIPTIWRFIEPTLTDDDVFPDLRMITMIGETSTWEDIVGLRKHLTPGASITNLLGQTEVMISRFDVTDETPLGTGPLPAGTPFPDKEIIIAGPDGEPLPVGEQGEITVATINCALGYWNRPEETEAHFERLADGRMLVRTGDAGRLREDGSLEHLGRIDHMVKISGNRVELGEIETALRRIDGVANAAVVTFEPSTGGKRLHAYVVADPGCDLDPQAVRSELAERLPRPMLPDRVELLDELPTLSGGKVDRRALTDRAAVAIPAQRPAPPPSATETALVALFCEVLERSDVNPDDDFFALGGDSLRAARLFAQIEKRLDVSRPVSLIVEAPTARTLAAALDCESWNQLITMQRGLADRTPLVIVHDGNGDVVWARKMLAQFGPDLPVYGLRAVTLTGQLPEETDFEGVVAGYVAQLQVARPAGPYMLYGWSLGGVIAFEMARQLQAAGHEVTMLALGDSSAPHPEMHARSMTLRSRALERARQLREADRRDALRLARDLAHRQLRHFADVRDQRAGRRVTASARSLVEELDEVLAAGDVVPTHLLVTFTHRVFGEMLKTYEPATPFDGSVLLLRARSRDHRPDRGWQPYVAAEVRTVDINADHNDLHVDDASYIAGDALVRAISRADSRR